jgi:hypothetical protein
LATSLASAQRVISQVAWATVVCREEGQARPDVAWRTAGSAFPAGVGFGCAVDVGCVVDLALVAPGWAASPGAVGLPAAAACGAAECGAAARARLWLAEGVLPAGLALTRTQAVTATLTTAASTVTARHRPNDRLAIEARPPPVAASPVTPLSAIIRVGLALRNKSRRSLTQ